MALPADSIFRVFQNDPTLGELIAWIIGWDLIIEYAIGNVAVAISWANYMNTLLEGFGIKLPPWMTIELCTNGW